MGAAVAATAATAAAAPRLSVSKTQMRLEQSWNHAEPVLAAAAAAAVGGGGCYHASLPKPSPDLSEGDLHLSSARQPCLVEHSHRGKLAHEAQPAKQSTGEPAALGTVAVGSRDVADRKVVL